MKIRSIHCHLRNMITINRSTLKKINVNNAKTEGRRWRRIKIDDTRTWQWWRIERWHFSVHEFTSYNIFMFAFRHFLWNSSFFHFFSSFSSFFLFLYLCFFSFYSSFHFLFFVPLHFILLLNFPWSSYSSLISFPLRCPSKFSSFLFLFFSPPLLFFSIIYVFRRLYCSSAHNINCT